MTNAARRLCCAVEVGVVPALDCQLAPLEAPSVGARPAVPSAAWIMRTRALLGMVMRSSMKATRVRHERCVNREHVLRA